MAKVVATVEARMTSSRLPGKVLLPAAGRPMLAHLLRRLLSVPSLDEIVVATTTNSSDDPIVSVAEDHGVSVYRGSEFDVLGRVAEALQAADATVAVNITADCPIIDPDLIEQAIRVFFANSVDVVSNSFVRSYPAGMDTSVLRVEAMFDAAREAMSQEEREHTLLFVRRRPQSYSSIALIAPPSLHWPGLGLTLDELEDYELLKTLIEELGPDDPQFGCGATVGFLRSNPKIAAINSGVERPWG